MADFPTVRSKSELKRLAVTGQLDAVHALHAAEKRIAELEAKFQRMNEQGAEYIRAHVDMLAKLEQAEAANAELVKLLGEVELTGASIYVGGPSEATVTDGWEDRRDQLLGLDSEGSDA